VSLRGEVLARGPLRCSWRVHLCAEQRGDAQGSGDWQRVARHGADSADRRTFFPGHDRRIRRAAPARVFPMAAVTWLACQGVVHFVIGRYCNYKSNQLMGVNLTAPVVQCRCHSR